jgi:branched-chain amino acid transport system substrate-binding protein
MTGPFADLAGPGSVAAAQLAVEDYGGKVLGRPVEIVSGDMQNKLDIAATIARRWYDEGIPAIIGIGNSGAAKTVNTLAKERNKISITSSAISTALLAEDCSPNSFVWTWDTFASAKGPLDYAMSSGSKAFYILTVDYAYGHAIESDAQKIIEAKGGKVLGITRHPIGTPDLSALLLKAQASGADTIALANAGTDANNTIKQAAEFQITTGNKPMRIVPLAAMITDVKSIGLKQAQGIIEADSFYWDYDAATRKFADAYMKKMGKRPTMLHAGTYTATKHYLEAVAAAGTDETKAVLAKFRSLPINDFMTKNGVIREDGRVMRPGLILEAKKPEESKNEWDLQKVVKVVPAEEAVVPLNQACSLVKKS